MEKKKVVIFGATGNTGNYVTQYAKDFFDKNEYEVIATGRRATDVFNAMDVKYYQVDITKEQDFETLPKENVYAIIFLAAKIPSYMNKYDPKGYLETNIMGAFNVLEYCRKVNADRIIYTQTVFDVSLAVEDGKKLDPYTSKAFSYKGDHAMYVISKNTAQDLIRHYHEEYGIKSFIFRLPTIYNYSPYQYYFPNGVKTLRPVYKMINNAIEGKDLELWGDPNYSKDMVHVYDFAQMLCRAVLVDREEGIYNVGTGMPVTMQEQMETIIEVFGDKNKSKIVYRPEKKSGGGFLMNIDNAIEELGYKPVYTCKKLFENYKEEMQKNTFAELRLTYVKED